MYSTMCMCKRTDVHVLLYLEKAVSHKISTLGKMPVCPFSRSVLCSELGRGTEEREGGRGRNLFCIEKNMHRRAVLGELNFQPLGSPYAFLSKCEYSILIAAAVKISPLLFLSLPPTFSANKEATYTIWSNFFLLFL